MFQIVCLVFSHSDARYPAENMLLLLCHTWKENQRSATTYNTGGKIDGSIGRSIVFLDKKLKAPRWLVCAAVLRHLHKCFSKISEAVYH